MITRVGGARRVPGNADSAYKDQLDQFLTLLRYHSANLIRG
nr:MAG TPA_asm: hypothetical protein [Caudoviricetes sp.]